MHYEIFCNNNIPGWVKRADKRSQNCQALVVKATAGLIKLFENLLNAEKQNYVVHTKGLLSLTMESMLLGHVNLSMNNMRRGMLKNSLQKDLHSFVKHVILPPFCSQGMTPQRKSVKQRNHQNLPHIPYLRARNIEHDIAHDTKTTGNTGINKYSKYKALRHSVYQGILQMQE